jgi:hypothetical protein
VEEDEEDEEEQAEADNLHHLHKELGPEAFTKDLRPRPRQQQAQQRADLGPIKEMWKWAEQHHKVPGKRFLEKNDYEVLGHEGDTPETFFVTIRRFIGHTRTEAVETYPIKSFQDKNGATSKQVFDYVRKHKLKKQAGVDMDERRVPNGTWPAAAQSR